jgi:hypothetical protein
MPAEYDLENVIEDSLTDAELPTDLEGGVEVSNTAEATDQIAEEKAVLDAQDAVADAATQTQETSAPGTEGKKKGTDWSDFDKKYGLEPTYPNSGRENRIPYSRVKKIAQKAVRDARKEWESEFSPKSQEWESHKANYEKELTSYRNFEKIMVQDPEKHLQMLASIPVYKEFFAAADQAFDLLEQYKAGKLGQPQAQGQDQTEDDGMPQPDVRLSDGSLVYSDKQLKAYNAWTREQARNETLAEVDKRYGPIEAEWQARQRVESLRPRVNAQIQEARTWDGFTENEAEIVEVLKNNPQISLEGAYRKVVLPKLKAAWEAEKQSLIPDRNKVRAELLQELKRAPQATAVPSTSSKAVPNSGPRSL